jgi:hypothetical protein
LTDGQNPWIIFKFEILLKLPIQLRIAFEHFLRILDHAAKLQHRKLTTILANSFLPEDNRKPIRNCDTERQDQEDR